jgi:hypothetical protein
VAKPVVVEGSVEIARWSENAEPDFRAALHWVAYRRPAEWSPNKTRVAVEIDASEAAAGERAVAAMLEQCRNSGGDYCEVLGVGRGVGER